MRPSRLVKATVSLRQIVHDEDHIQTLHDHRLRRLAHQTETELIQHADCAALAQTTTHLLTIA